MSRFSRSSITRRPKAVPLAAGIITLLLIVVGAGFAATGTYAAVSGGPAGSAAPDNPLSSSLVISQIYGGGGNAGAPWHNDFIELFNPTAVTVTVSGWTVQYTSSTGNSWQATALNGSVPPGGYFLVQEAAGTGGGLPLPTPDASGNIPMSGTSGKVALVNTTALLSCGNAVRCLPNAAIIDFVGYGSAATDFEGTGPTATLSNTTSAIRNAEGCSDTDSNSADFVPTGNITPRNSSTPHHSCDAATATPTFTSTPAGPTNTPTNTATVGSPTDTITPAPSPTCNLLTNPGFDTGQLSPWVTTTPGITVAVVASPVASGGFAVAVTSSFTVTNGGSQGIQQDVDTIVEGATYHVSAAVLRSASNIASARIRVTWYPCAAQGCGGTNQDMFLGSNSPNWQTVSADMIPPAGTLSARFKPVFYTSDGQPATIYFDDLVFECPPVNTSTPTPTVTDTITPGGPTLSPTNTATVTVTGTPVSPIGTVQGSGLRSPFAGQVVTVQGVVTVIESNGFFIQDGGDGNPDTSDGIFVFTSSFPSTVAPGQLVRVRGTVSEFRSNSRPCDLTVTELGTVTITQLGTSSVPAPVVISNVPVDQVIYPDAINFYEKYEGMVVQVPNAEVIGGTSPDFGELWILAGGDQVPGSGYIGDGHISVHPTATADVDYNPERILIDDESRGAGNVNARIVGADGQSIVNVGDRISAVTGVLDYGFSNYRIQPLVDPEGAITRTPIPVPPASNLPTPGPGEFRVASFNVENFFDAVDNPLKTQTAVPANEILTKTLKVTQAISVELNLPDVVIVQEIEDASVLNGDANGNVPGSNVRAVVPRLRDAGHNYTAVSAGSSDVRGIQVGFLYDTDRATLNSYYQATTIMSDTGGVWVGGREPLVGNFTVGGHNITMIGNHWKSKGGDDPLYGDPTCQPPTRSTEDLRKAQAQYVRNYVNMLENANPSIKVLVAGDLNDYYFPEPGEGRDPVSILKGGTITDTSTLTDLIELVPEADRYTYNFEGNAQVLDHMLINPNLFSSLNRQAIAHFDADFSNDYSTDQTVPYKTSDHDPPVGYFRTLTASTPTPTRTATPQGVINGHLTWQSLSQPDAHNVQTATLVICNAGVPNNYAANTDASGNFVVITGLPDGTYNWWIKGNRHLANAGALTFAAGSAIQEMGLMKGGDAVHTGTSNNQVDSSDFNNLRSSFGLPSPPDLSSDFNFDGQVNASDFNILRSNFGLPGAAQNCP